VAEQGLAPLLNPHFRFLRAVNPKMVNFVDRFVENTGGLENRPVVHADDERAAKLIEVKFDKVFVRAPDFQTEFHMSRFYVLLLQSAFPVPLVRKFSFANPSRGRRAVRSGGAAIPMNPESGPANLQC
jgi:hypothetical protein